MVADSTSAGDRCRFGQSQDVGAIVPICVPTNQPPPWSIMFPLFYFTSISLKLLLEILLSELDNIQCGVGLCGWWYH